MNKWNDYFTITQIPAPDSSASNWMLNSYFLWELRDPDGKLIGTYKDHKYAKKQAKYKFKKMMSKLERILLT